MSKNGQSVPVQTEREIQGAIEVQTTTVGAIARAEIDSQVATAKQYPRSITGFLREVQEMAALNEEVAQSCMYALPRDGKTIEGPTARLAEIVASAWGNCRAAARVIGEEGDYVVAQGTFHDLERNVGISYEVRRRIVNARGLRYNVDMVGVTGNAAASIALRNAVLKGVPKAFWNPAYLAARRVVAGDVKSLAQRRSDAMAYLLKFGVTEDRVLTALNVPGVADIGLEELVTLKGAVTAIREGEVTPEEAFPVVSIPKSRDYAAQEVARQKAENAIQTATDTERENTGVGVGMDVEPADEVVEVAATDDGEGRVEVPTATSAAEESFPDIWKRLQRAVKRGRKAFPGSLFVQEVPKGTGTYFYTDVDGIKAVGEKATIILLKGGEFVVSPGVMLALAEDLESRCEASKAEVDHD